MTICRLCKEPKTLVLSHVMPNFAVKAARDQSFADQFISHEETPKLVQQAFRRDLLCSDCDGKRIGNLESEFCKQIFNPFRQGQRLHVHYDSWLLGFAVSLAWRATIVHLEDGLITSKSDAMHLRKACHTWRQFLLGRSRNPGLYQHHLHLFDVDEIDRQLNAVRHKFEPDLKQGFYAWMVGHIGPSILRGSGKSSGQLAILAKFANGVLLSYINPHWQHRPCIGSSGVLDLSNQLIDPELVGTCRALHLKALHQVEFNASEELKSSIQRKNREQISKSKVTGHKRLQTHQKDQQLPVG